MNLVRKIGLVLLISVCVGLYFMLGGEEESSVVQREPTAKIGAPQVPAEPSPAPIITEYHPYPQAGYPHLSQPYSAPTVSAYTSPPVTGYTFRPLGDREKKRLEEERMSAPAYAPEPGLQQPGAEPYGQPDPYAARSPYTEPTAGAQAYAGRYPQRAPTTGSPQGYESPYAIQPSDAEAYMPPRPYEVPPGYEAAPGYEVSRSTYETPRTYQAPRTYEAPYAVQAPPAAYTPPPAAEPSFRFRPLDERRETRRWTENYSPPEQYVPYMPRQAPARYYSAPNRDPSQQHRRQNGPFGEHRTLWADSGLR